MNNRQQELAELKAFIETADKETTLLLQTLNWEQKNVLEASEMVSCKYVANHMIPLTSRENHEKNCYLVQMGYDKSDVLLPDPINPDSSTVVKFGKEEIMSVINAASALNPSFKRACGGPEPLSLERLQQMYTADERAAIHAAVVAAAPFCHDLTDLALPCTSSDGAPAGTEKGRVEILSELRDMKRRRTKYRVAAKTNNYSHMLRDVINTQMDMYAEAKGVLIKTEYGSKSYMSINKPDTTVQYTPTDVFIKREILSPEEDQYGDSIRHRRRYRSREKHEEMRTSDREPNSRKRRDLHHGKDDTDRTYRDKRHDRDNDKQGSKDRKRHRSKRERSDRHSEVKEHNSTSRDSMRKDRLDDDHRKHTKHKRLSSKSSYDDTTCKERDRYDKNHKKSSTRESGEYGVKTQSDRHKSSKKEYKRERDKRDEVQDHKNDDNVDKRKKPKRE